MSDNGSQVMELSAFVRSGQVFLTWDEESKIEGEVYEVFMDSSPITVKTLGNAQQVGHHIETASACDWWKDPVSFRVDATPDRSHGYVLDGKELDPTSGLFVHTVIEGDPSEMYFAVLPASADASSVQLGVNSLERPVRASPGFPQPFKLKAAPAAGSARGKSLTLVLHGRGGGEDPYDTSNYLLFGDGRQGWRQGLARKFTVSSDENGIIIEPRDWTWVGRPLLFSNDRFDHSLAINTWWYGCSDKIYDETAGTEGVVFNYTEEHLLYLVRWAQQEFGTDPNQTHIKGLSMGGSGAISMGFNHPEVFATIFSSVPIVSYTNRVGFRGQPNVVRMNGPSGRIFDETVMTNEGISLLERLDNERIVREYEGDLPFLVLSNGRTDNPIPWVNNPPFYRALNEAKRGFVSYWNNEGHGMWESVPADVTDFYVSQPIVLNQSYPAFSNNSSNRDPGDGSREDGDLVGWMNRGIHWTDLVETENSWKLTLHADGDFLPASLTVDVTPRNLQKFQILPNEELLVNGQSIQADSTGTLTLDAVELKKGVPTALLVQRSQHSVE
ncbi:alpha/beta hydrolase-fold protein [Coraliomargarita sp. W4R72]